MRQLRLKNNTQIDSIRTSSRMAAETLDMISEHISEGISLNEINILCHEYITLKLKAIPAPLNYFGFPKSICTSVNDVACHGIPNDYILKSNDTLNIDVTVIKDGWHGDTSRMYIVGDSVNQSDVDLIEKTHQAMMEAIDICKVGVSTSEIGRKIQDFSQKNNLSIVKEFCGHGIGKRFHEEPTIYHYYSNLPAMKMDIGMVFTIEPIFTFGNPSIITDIDGWTTRTVDGSVCAQWEHTIAIANSGAEILTRIK